MRSRRTLTKVAVAAAATVLLITACTSNGNDDPTPAPETSPVGTPPATGTDLQSVLLTEEEHPAGTTVLRTSTLKQASALVLPGTGEPSGVAVMPRCMSYFAAIGGLDAYDGWHQFGVREDNTLFLNMIAQVPSGEEAIELIRLRINGCPEGLMSIQGWPPSVLADDEVTATGTMAFAENDVLSLPGATTLTFTQTVTFHDPDHPTAQAIREAWGCPDIPCTSQTVFVATDDVLIYVLEGEELAVQVATTMYDRAVG